MAQQIKILMADDEADFRQVMTFWLNKKGYEVVPAVDGQNAIQLLKQHKPDIIFLDLNMPVLDGVETLKKIRELDKTIPVIMISAFVDDKRINEAISCGISGVFYKGKDFQEGLNLLEVALRTHKNLKK
jgi:two-component system, OmpR family, response regulator VanR